MNGRAAFTEAEAREYESRYLLDRTIANARDKAFALDAAGADIDTYEPGKLHLVERFSLSDPNTLKYAFTIDDPASFVRQWTADSQMTRTTQRMYEYACHEANYSMSNVLSGARFSEKQKKKER